jgi:mono/diheme cytochrome c family protein
MKLGRGNTVYSALIYSALRRSAAGVAAILLSTAATAAPPDFSRDVQPLLKARCLGCHGPKLQMHGLRLDRKASALKGGESGVPAVVPGNSAQSLLIKYVSANSDVMMPPSGPRLTAEEISLLRTWIDHGAAWPDDSPIDSEAKHSRHWAFQPITSPPVPVVRSAGVRNQIDAFILDKLQQRHWKPAPPAAPRALLRRIYLDLTGLPPTLEEQDHPPANLDALVDELLARPTYGERWGRHWLDLARYAETNGYERDATKPNAWRYRDYVINAFNNDKPFNRFVLEQLAGDELPNPTAETFTALGYYRLGPWDDEPADPETDRFDQLDDIVSTTSQVFLGLTLGCARCHNHKFEPLSARDYYSMVAIFNGLERPRNGRTEYDLPAGTLEEVKAATENDNKIYAYEKKIAEITKAVKPLTPEAKAEIAEIQAHIDELRRTGPNVQRAYYLNEPKPEPPPTFLLIRGKASQPGPEVPPAIPEILGKQPVFPTPERTSLRRLTFAQWLVSPDNPLTARVIVNRVWQHHFGEGLVRTPSDFGVMGEKPTHPELLDWLAKWFMDNGWSIKKLNRLILASNTYRMSKQWNAVYGAADPEDHLLWRMPYQRLEVEAIRDSALAASGQLNPKMFGPSMYPHIPAAAMEGSSDPDKIWKESDEREASRRTIYAFIKRSMVVPMLEVLDLCDSTRTAAKRQNTSVATQALTLFNGDFVNRQSQHLADRLRTEGGSDPAKQIDLAYRLTLARPPTPVETQTMLDFLKREPLEQMCRVMFNLNEFAYVD